MTVGENIRRIRKQRHLTIRQLGEMVGVKESYIRAYESGRRNPKPASLEMIARALAVNPEVLKSSDFDGVQAMHRLFQIFRMYGGKLMEVPDGDNERIAVSFDGLVLMREWYYRYEQYEEGIATAEGIKNNAERAKAILDAEREFDYWMDMFPEMMSDPSYLEMQKIHDMKLDLYGSRPEDSEDKE